MSREVIINTNKAPEGKRPGFFEKAKLKASSAFHAVQIAEQGIINKITNITSELDRIAKGGDKLTPKYAGPQVDSNPIQDKKADAPKKTMDDIKPGLLDGVFANTFSDRFLGRPKVTSPRNTPHVLTAREIIDANSGKMAPHGLEKAIQDAAKNRAARTVAAGAALAGTAYITVNQGPAIIRSIMSIKDNVAGWFSNFGGGEKTEVPTVFDNTKVKGIIDDSNITRLPKEEIASLNLTPEYNPSTETVKYLFPFKMPEGTTATIDKTIRVKEGADISHNPIVTRETPLIKFSTAGVEAIVPSPDTHVQLFKGNAEWGEDPNFAYWVRFYHYDNVQDATIVLTIGSNIGTKDGAFTPLIPMLDFNSEKARETDTSWENLPVVPVGTSIMTTTDAEQSIDFRVRTYKGKIVGAVPDSDIKEPYTQFFADASNGEKIKVAA